MRRHSTRRRKASESDTQKQNDTVDNTWRDGNNASESRTGRARFSANTTTSHTPTSSITLTAVPASLHVSHSSSGLIWPPAVHPQSLYRVYSEPELYPHSTISDNQSHNKNNDKSGNSTNDKQQHQQQLNEHTQDINSNNKNNSSSNSTSSSTSSTSSSSSLQQLPNNKRQIITLKKKNKW